DYKQPAEDIRIEATLADIRADPHHMPTFTPPEPWTDVRRIGEWGERQSLIRCPRKSPILNAVRDVMASGRTQLLDALHRLERLAFKINAPMLRVVRRAGERATFDKPLGLEKLFVQKTILRKRRGKIQLRRGKSPIIARRGDRRPGAAWEFGVDM